MGSCWLLVSGTNSTGHNSSIFFMKYLCFLAVLIASGLALNASEAAPSPKILIAADSTAADFSDWAKGWPEAARRYLAEDGARLVNFAHGGVSSRTFITTGFWEKLLKELRAGDLVFIQFSHHEADQFEKSNGGGSLPGLGNETQLVRIRDQEETVHTFGWYLRKMIDDTKRAKATPVLVTSTVKNVWRGGVLVNEGNKYDGWLKELAVQQQVPLVDLNAVLTEEYERLSADRVKAFFPRDRNHTNIYGTDLTARLLLSGLMETQPGLIAPFLNSVGKAITFPSAAARKSISKQLPMPQRANLPSIFVVGDESVRAGSGVGVGGQWGWGDLLSKFVDASSANLVNRGLPLASARFNVERGHWQRTLALMKTGDVVLIQFGHHDDEPIEGVQGKGALPGVGPEVTEAGASDRTARVRVRTYGSYLQQMVDDVKALGAIPILVSPSSTGPEVSPDRRAALTKIGEWTKTIADKNRVAFIDLLNASSAAAEAAGGVGKCSWFADGGVITTFEGGLACSRLVAQALVNVPTARHIKVVPPSVVN